MLHIPILAVFYVSDIFVLSFTSAIWTDGCHKRSLVSMSIWGGTIHPAGMTRGQQARQPSPSVTPAPSDTRGHSVKLPTQRDSYKIHYSFSKFSINWLRLIRSTYLNHCESSTSIIVNQIQSAALVSACGSVCQH